MNELNVILLHGTNTDPSKNWYPWLINEMKNKNIKCFVPQLPNAKNPVLFEWLNEIDKLNPNQDTILIGHSRGGMAILRWLERRSKNKKVKKVILVATNNPNISEKNKKANTNGFYEKGSYDYEEIKNHCTDFVVLHSKDDIWVPFASGEENAKGLNAKFLIFEDMGHFGSQLLRQEIPELIDEILK